MQARVVSAFAVAVLAAGSAAGTACSEDPAADRGAPTSIVTTATTAAGGATTMPTTATTATTAPATTETTDPPAPTTTAAYDGLPETIPIPVAGMVVVSPGATYTDSFFLSGVTGEGALAWLVERLPLAGWTIVDQTTDEGTRRRGGFQATIDLTGRGATGTVALTQRPSGVTVEVELEPRS